MLKKLLKSEDGFSLTELLIVLVIIGILVLLALPNLLPLVTKAKTTEAKLNLKQVLMLQKSYKFEYDKYSSDLEMLGYKQEPLVTEGGNARYTIEIIESDVNAFRALATAVVDFDDDGTYNVWEVTEAGNIVEKVKD